MTQRRYTDIPKRQKCVNKEEPYIGGADGITFSYLSASQIIIKILRVGNDKDMYNRSKAILSYDLVNKRVIEIE